MGIWSLGCLRIKGRQKHKNPKPTMCSITLMVLLAFLRHLPGNCLIFCFPYIPPFPYLTLPKEMKKHSLNFLSSWESFECGCLWPLLILFFASLCNEPNFIISGSWMLVFLFVHFWLFPFSSLTCNLFVTLTWFHIVVTS